MDDVSDRRKAWRASGTQEISRETISLFHPLFSQDWHLTTWEGGFDGIVRGESVSFLPHAFSYELPAVTTSGRFEMSVDLYRAGDDMMQEIRTVAAKRTNGAIECEFNAYFEADAEPDETFGPLKLTDIGASARGVSVTGRWLDFLNLRFLRMAFTADLYPGLVRG